MRVVIDTGGVVKAVYSDRLKNMNIGPMSVTRASNVEFNEKTQLWEAITPEGELIAQGPNRDDVIQAEVAEIESRL